MNFTVWRETRVLPRHQVAAFRDGQDALNWAELRAQREEETRDITVWRTVEDDVHTRIATFKPKAAAA